VKAAPLKKAAAKKLPSVKSAPVKTASPAKKVAAKKASPTAQTTLNPKAAWPFPSATKP
jgi:hypothetical protein